MYLHSVSLILILTGVHGSRGFLVTHYCVFPKAWFLAWFFFSLYFTPWSIFKTVSPFLFIFMLMKFNLSLRKIHWNAFKNYVEKCHNNHHSLDCFLYMISLDCYTSVCISLLRHKKCHSLSLPLKPPELSSDMYKCKSCGHSPDYRL